MSFLIFNKMENVCGTTRNKIIISVIGLLLVVAIPLIIVFTVGGETSTQLVQTTTEQITTTTEGLFYHKIN